MTHSAFRGNSVKNHRKSPRITKNHRESLIKMRIIWRICTYGLPWVIVSTKHHSCITSRASQDLINIHCHLISGLLFLSRFCLGVAPSNSGPPPPLFLRCHIPWNSYYSALLLWLEQSMTYDSSIYTCLPYNVATQLSWYVYLHQPLPAFTVILQVLYLNGSV